MKWVMFCTMMSALLPQQHADVRNLEVTILDSSWFKLKYSVDENLLSDFDKLLSDVGKLSSMDSQSRLKKGQQLLTTAAKLVDTSAFFVEPEGDNKEEISGRSGKQLSLFRLERQAEAEVEEPKPFGFRIPYTNYYLKMVDRQDSVSTTVASVLTLGAITVGALLGRSLFAGFLGSGKKRISSDDYELVLPNVDPDFNSIDQQYGAKYPAVNNDRYDQQQHYQQHYLQGQKYLPSLKNHVSNQPAYQPSPPSIPTPQQAPVTYYNQVRPQYQTKHSQFGYQTLGAQATYSQQLQTTQVPGGQYLQGFAPNPSYNSQSYQSSPQTVASNGAQYNYHQTASPSTVSQTTLASLPTYTQPSRVSNPGVQDTLEKLLKSPDFPGFPYTYDPFYGPRLSRIDSIFSHLNITSEYCKERMVCSVYKSPTLYSPVSELLSHQISVDVKDLKTPSSPNPEVLRFFRYLKAAKDGTTNENCIDKYPDCAINTDNLATYPMINIYNKIDDLVNFSSE